MATQCLLRHLDGNFIGAGVKQFCLGNRGQGDDVIAQLLADHLQGALIGVPGDGDLQHRGQYRYFGSDRFFRLSGECIDGIHFALYVVCHPIFIDAIYQLNNHRAEPFGSGRANLVDSLCSLYRFLYAHADSRFNFLWCRTQIGNFHLYGVYFNVGEFFLVNLRQGEQSARYQQQHQKIGGNGVVDKPGDNARHTGPTAAAV